MADNDWQAPKPADPDTLLAAIRAAGGPKPEAGEEKSGEHFNPSKKAGVDFAATVVGGVVLGLVLDLSFGWTPWATIGLMFGGFAAGLVNIWRALHVKQDEGIK